jgi:A/G-specific adenine glycosylase
MLQQTQVPRVIEKYKSFIRKFPTARTLANASLADVLKEWSGLGYNRRAKYLRDAARVIVGQYKENVQEALKNPLPGVGPYTGAAVRTFAFNEPHTFIETNIRAAYIHFFYSSVLQKTRINDRALLPFIQKVAEGQDPRTWHWALMDYGAHLKRSGVRNNHRNAHYTKQSKFEGSLRQVRGAILQQLMKGNDGLKGMKGEKWEKALEGLAKDGLIKSRKGKWRIA